MSWANIRELIFQERKLLGPAAVVEFPQESAFETQQSALLASYLATKAGVDAAVSAFAQTLEWPPLSAFEKFFVARRLDFAWEVASMLSTPHAGEALIPYPSPENCTTAELLEWLLIDVWPYGCSRFLQAQRWTSEPSAHSKGEGLAEQVAPCVA